MSKKAKTWLIFILILIGLAGLLVGWFSSAYSITMASAIALVFWVGAIVVALTVKGEKSVKPMSKMVHDEGCRKATQRR